MSEGARDLVRVEQSAVRCPFCHEGVDVAESDWVACAGCLARHHGECWTEAGRCGGCGGGEKLARAGAAPVAPAASPQVQPAAVTPAAVTPAAASEPPSTFERVFGAPRRVRVERTTPGDVGDGADEDVVNELRRRVGEPGTFERLGRTLTWRHIDKSGHVSVSVTARDGTVTVAAEERMGQLVGGLYGGIGGGLGTNLLLHPLIWGIIQGWPWLIALGALSTALLLLLLRRLVVWSARRKRTRLQDVVAAVEGVLEKHVRRPRVDPKAGKA